MLLGRVWKPVYCAPVVRVLGAIGYTLTPIHTKLVSWQAEQFPVIPVWIWVVVGAGVANAVPGAVFVAEAATIPVGVVARCQVSHEVIEGMCALVPTGEVGGITTIWLTPAKLAPVIDAPWQLSQLLVMPVWLISELLNLAPLLTGRLATLEPEPTWQVSQAALVGMWLPGSPTMLKFAAGIAKPAAALPWHCAQLLVVLGALAWMLVTVGITE